MATSIARERERGTMEQLAVTPLTAAEIFIGKLLPYFLLALLDTVNVMIVARWLFGVSLAGHYPVVATLIVVFILASLGIGQLISAVSKNQSQAMQLAVFYIMSTAATEELYRLAAIGELFYAGRFDDALRAVRGR